MLLIRAISSVVASSIGFASCVSGATRPAPVPTSPSTTSASPSYTERLIVQSALQLTLLPRSSTFSSVRAEVIKEGLALVVDCLGANLFAKLLLDCHLVELGVGTLKVKFSRVDLILVPMQAAIPI